jgi:transcriptional regulator with XRE-family HTH domain
MSNKETSKRFAELFRQLQQSPTYRIEGLKVEISEQIYQAMQRGHISNAELARRLGKSRAYVTKILSGNVNFTLETLVIITAALNYELKFEMTPRSMIDSWASVPAIQTTRRALNWRDQDYIKLVVNNTNPHKFAQERNHVPISAAA